METRNIVFLCVVLGDLLVLHGAEGLHLKGSQLYNGEGGKGFQRRIYHSPTDARNIPYSPTVAKDIPAPPPSQPYLDKLLRLVSRVNERHENEKKWRNLKVLDEQEKNFMSDSDVEASDQKVKEEELRKTESRRLASAEVPYGSGKLANQGGSKEQPEYINLKRKVENEKDEDEQENDDENEEQEDEGEIDKEKNEEDESNGVIDEDEEGSKDEGNEGEEGEKSETNKNDADDKRRLMTLLMRELKDLETENSQIG